MKYYIANPGGQPEGPYTVDELRSRAITPATLVYNEELGKWTAAGDVPELSTYLFGGAQNPLTTPNGGYQTCSQTQAASGMPEPVRPKTWLAESILVTLFCCLPFGIVAIVKAAGVDSKFNSRDYQGAMQASKDAGTWVKWSFICGLAGALIYIFLIVIGGVGSSL